MSLLQLFALAIGAVIGVGWITGITLWIASAGPVGAALAFVGGALICTPIARCYGHLGAQTRGSGGEMIYGRMVFGPAGEILAGVGLLLAYIVVCAFEAVSVGWIITEMVPQSAGPRIYAVFDRDVTLGEIIVIVLFTAMIIAVQKWGIRGVARTQTALMLAKLTIVFGLVVAAVISGDPGNLQPMFTGTADRSPLAGFVAVLITTPFWFAGFNVAAQASDSLGADYSARRLKFAMTSVVWVSAAFYCAIILSAAAVTSPGDFASASLPAAAAFEAAFGSRLWSNIVLLAGLFGLVTTWNAVFFAGVRVLTTLAKREGVAARSSAGLLPTWSIATVALVSTALALLGRGTLGVIANIVGFIFACMFFITCTACLRRPLAARAPSGSDALSRRTAATGVAVSLCLIVLWCFDVFGRAVAGAWPLELTVLAGWIAVSVALLALGRRGTGASGGEVIPQRPESD